MKLSPIQYAMITILCWSFGISIMKMMINNNQMLAMNVSYFFGIITLLLICLKEYGSFKKLIEILKSFSIWHYVFASTGYFFCYLFTELTYESFEKDISIVTVLNYTWPIFSFLFIRFFVQREKFTKKTMLEIIGLIVAFAGIFILATKCGMAGAGAINLTGIGLGLMIGVSYGLFSAFSFKLNTNVVTAFMLLAVVLGLILNLIYSMCFTNFNLSNFVWQDLFWCLLFGVVIDGLGYYFWGKAKSLANEQKINIAPITSSVFFLPIFSITISSLLFKAESINHAYFWISFGMVFIGSMVIKLSEKLIKTKNESLARLSDN
jgi:drug/metabolite transporter (DMT)-like permease